MRVPIVLGVAVALIAVSSMHTAQARVETVKADRDSGLYKIEAAPNGAPGVLGTNRGIGGRFDLSGTATNNGFPDDPDQWTPGGPNETVLMGFDLSGLDIQPGEFISAAVLNVYKPNTEGFGWDVDVVAYPLAEAWQEGTGNSFSATPGVGGETGFPWGPAQVGDAVHDFRVVTEVVPGEGAFDNFGNPFDVASEGIAWSVPGALGVGSDLIAGRKMFKSRQTGRDNGTPGIPNGGLIAAMELQTAGLSVLTDWENGSLANNGLNLFFETDYGDPREGGSNGKKSTWRAASSEYFFGGVQGAVAPELVITIVPEPTTLVLLGLGLVGVGLSTRKRR